MLRFSVKFRMFHVMFIILRKIKQDLKVQLLMDKWMCFFPQIDLAKENFYFQNQEKKNNFI